MSNRLWPLVAAICSVYSSVACDVCGSYLSLYPRDRQSNISFLFRNRTMRGPVTRILQTKHGNAEQETGEYLELYSTLEFRANVFLSKSVSIVASVPTVNRYRSIDRKRMADSYGVGDPWFMANAILFDRLDEASGKGVRLTAAMGGKAPLGKTDLSFNGELLDPDMQAGTGSWDPMFSIAFLGRQGEWGIGTQWISSLSGYYQDRRYGHSQNLNVEFFRTVSLKKTVVAPMLGLYGEQFGNEYEDGEVVENTSGSVAFVKAGARAWRGQWQLQAEVQYTVAEEHAINVPSNRHRMLVAVSHYLNKNQKTK